MAREGRRRALRTLGAGLAVLLGLVAEPITASATSSPIPDSPPELAFHPYQERLLDTRTSAQTVGPDSTLTIPTSTCMPTGAPPCLTHGLALNVTATDTTADSWFAVYTEAAPYPTPPTRSNQNWRAGQTVAAQAVVGFGMSGDQPVFIYNHAGSVDFVVDLAGYFVSPAPTDGYGQYKSLPSARLLDTRSSAAIAPGGTLRVRVLGSAGVPAAGVAGVVANVTVVGGAAPGYLTVYPTALSPRSPPPVSSLNWAPDQVVANADFMGVGADGGIAIYNGSAAAVDVIVDVTGYFTDAGAVPGSGALLITVRNYRVIDTRTSSPVSAGSPLDVPLPPYGNTAATVVAVTATDTSAAGYLSCCGAPGVTSALNWAGGQTAGNAITVPLTSVRLEPSSGSADFVVDLLGYFWSRTASPAPSPTPSPSPLRAVVVALSASPSAISADGASTSSLTATVTTGTGAPLVGAEIAFVGSGPLINSCGMVSPYERLTDEEGIVTATYTSSTTVGSCTMTAIELMTGALGSTVVTQTAPAGLVG